MWRVIAALAVSLALGRAAAAAPVWTEDEEGRRFRIAFDPGRRFFVGTGVARDGSSVTSALELALDLRAPPPPPDAPVFWKRDHELGHLRLRPAAAAWLEGRLYRGTFLRHARDGALTFPTTPPVRLALPFDVGVRVELGSLAGAFPVAPGVGLSAGVVRGEAMADLLRSEHPGRWIALGVIGSYDVDFERRGQLLRDHRVTPLTSAAASAHGESARGLVSGGLRAEWARLWSSRHGWGQEWRFEGDLEVTPVAVNDLPLSLVLSGRVELGRAGLVGPAAHLLAGVRLGAPLSRSD
jgi:hypothetical protein